MGEDEELKDIRERAAKLGYVVARPYEKVAHEGEGATEEFQLVPTAQIDTYQEVIRRLKGER